MRHAGSAPELPSERPAGVLDADTAVTVLYGAHWRPLVRLAALLTGDESVAEEIAQDAFVGLYRRWGSVRDSTAGLAYLRTSVVNGARSAVRRRQVRLAHRPPPPPEPAGPDEAAARAMEDARVLAALRSLSRRQEEVLVLRYWADLDEQEIAETLGISRGSVKVHVHRATAALRQALASSGVGR